MSQASVHAKLTPSGARQGLAGVPAEKNLIPKLDQFGVLTGVVIVDATTAIKGKVLLAVAGGTVPFTVVQATDPRLFVNHAGIPGLLSDDHTQYALLAGRAGGQTYVAGTAVGNALLLRATANAGGGPIIFEDSPGSEIMRLVAATNALIIGATVAVSAELLRVAGNVLVDAILQVNTRIRGGVAASDDLILAATDHATGGPVKLQSTFGTTIFQADSTENRSFIKLTAGAELRAESTFRHVGTTFGVFSKVPVVQASAYVQTFATADRTIDAYVSDPESVVYTLVAAGADTVDRANTAKLSDLNALRVAYENLRLRVEDNTQAINALIDDSQAFGFSP